MDRCYVKPVFDELWDSYQLKIVTIGGNQKFWDFMKEYKSEMKPMGAKYRSKEAKYYRKMLAAFCQEKTFLDKPPPKNVDEYIDKGVDLTKKGAKKAEVVLTKVGGALESQFNKWFK